MTKSLLIIWLISVLSQDPYTPGSLNRFIGRINLDTLDKIEYVFVESSQRDLNPEKFILLIWCESQFDNRGGDYSTTTKTFLSNGWLQFKKSTFVDFSKLYKFSGKYDNTYDQIRLAATALADGKWRHWYTCSKRSGINIESEKLLLLKNNAKIKLGLFQ